MSRRSRLLLFLCGSAVFVYLVLHIGFNALIADAAATGWMFVPIVLLYYGGSWGLFSTKHFTGWPSASDPYTLPTNYNYSLLTVVTHLVKA